MKKEELKERVDEMLSRGISTLDYYFKLYPQLQTEREALHQSILQTILGRKTHSKSKRIFMVGGAPANGKSAFIRNGPVLYPENILKIDPDEIKLLPTPTLIPQLIDNQIFDELHLWDTTSPSNPD